MNWHRTLTIICRTPTGQHEKRITNSRLSTKRNEQKSCSRDTWADLAAANRRDLVTDW